MSLTIPEKYRTAVAGLGAAAIAAWFACPVPPRGLFTPGRALRAVVVYLLAVTLACAVSAFVTERNTAHRAPRIRFLIAIAIWFAPAATLIASRRSFAIYLTSQSTLEAFAVLLIPVGIWWLDRPESPPDLAYAGGMFALPHTTRLMRQLPLSIGLALLAELIAAVVISGDLSVGLLLAFSGLILFWRARSWLRRKREIAPLTTTIAVILTVACIGRFMALQQSNSGAHTGAGGASETRTVPLQTEAGVANGLDGWAGVILIPEVQQHVTIVPPLPAMNSDLFRKADDHPLTIPFFGVYWFYRFPASRPPPNSVTMRGTPEDIRFRSLGRVQLKMEAHQNLGKLIEVSCCSRIRVAIHNSEHSPEPNRVQLILANTTATGEPPAYLTMQPVDGSEHQVLDFPLGSIAHLQRFDELTVRFFRAWTTSQLSARISIERFVLVPRGR